MPQPVSADGRQGSESYLNKGMLMALSVLSHKRSPELSADGFSEARRQ
jgi:hypothetical protein